jgi:hypothetical protein
MRNLKCTSLSLEIKCVLHCTNEPTNFDFSDYLYASTYKKHVFLSLITNVCALIFGFCFCLKKNPIVLINCEIFKFWVAFEVLAHGEVYLHSTL